MLDLNETSQKVCMNMLLFKKICLIGVKTLCSSVLLSISLRLRFLVKVVLREVDVGSVGSSVYSAQAKVFGQCSF